VRTAVLNAVAVLVLAGCSSGVEPAAGAPTTDPPPTGAAPPAAGVPPAAGQRIEQTTRAVLGGVELELEVADEPQERAVGLMGRTEVPAGTGMVFLFDEPVSTSFYMFQVPVPLVAAFVRDGTVVGVLEMEPCGEPEPGNCPTYAPDQAFDVVVETAPATLAGLEPGARLEPARPGG
jgi:uncharacterized protein